MAKARYKYVVISNEYGGAEAFTTKKGLKQYLTDVFSEMAWYGSDVTAADLLQDFTVRSFTGEDLTDLVKSLAEKAVKDAAQSEANREQEILESLKLQAASLGYTLTRAV